MKVPAKIQAVTDKHKHVDCPRCGAAVGEPCTSCMGNPTYPHMARKEASAALAAAPAFLARMQREGVL